MHLKLLKFFFFDKFEATKVDFFYFTKATKVDWLDCAILDFSCYAAVKCGAACYLLLLVFSCCM